MRDDKRVAGRLSPLGSIWIPDDFTVAEAHCSLGRVPARPAHRVTVKYDRAIEVAARQRLQPFTEERLHVSLDVSFSNSGNPNRSSYIFMRHRFPDRVVWQIIGAERYTCGIDRNDPASP